MRSVCPRLFLLVIIQGINLVYSPQEPVDVALDLPAESLETQSVGTNKQLGFSHSCRMNTGRHRSLWSSVTFDGNCTCFCGWCIFCDRHTYHVECKMRKKYACISIQIHQTQVVGYEAHNAWYIAHSGTSKWWIAARCFRPIYSWYLDLW